MVARGGPQSRFPMLGLDPAELTAALALIASEPQISDRRVLSLTVQAEGFLLVQTGAQQSPRTGSGQVILMHRAPDGWQILETSSWQS